MSDGLNEIPEPDSARVRVAPKVVLAAAGVVVATLFAAVAALTGSPNDEATPAKPILRDDVVSRSTLSNTQIKPKASSEAPAPSSEAPATDEAPATVAEIKTKVTTVTRADGTTTTTTVEDTTTEQPQPPRTTTTPRTENPPTHSSPSNPPTVTDPTVDPPSPTEPTTPPSEGGTSGGASGGASNDGASDR
ncbi:hypothetical protein [Umezawaea sp. Da 62-37]|uniref:hypothetical protein n=1 Tax=Umezawaea sp. Da 62-37 TaxID=3075927 RepID=UPI0028F6E949|nr:hypothetical protein [Umezawaea sp. Da 62-37]WNV89930.1 hypothetical protein RM788_17010 [Umezawaea sp. Da 62-37]